MSALPFVSICIPTYNAGKFLQACILSALQQSYPHFEILISDDNSQDGSLDLIRKFQHRHPRIRLVHNLEKGMVNNWNNCIREAKGEWVKFLFQDDLLEPLCVEKMIEACLKHNVLVGLCRRNFILHDNVSEKGRRNFSEGGITKAEELFEGTTFITPGQLAEVVKKNLVNNFLGEPTCYFFHKDLLKVTAAFDPTLKQVVDYEFILRLGLAKGLAFVPDTLAHFRVHGNSQTSANTGHNNKTRQRRIEAVTGDFLLLCYAYLNKPEFELVKKTVGEEDIENFMKYLYHTACKHEGENNVKEALAVIRDKFPVFRFRYHFFSYVYYRYLVKSWEKKNKKVTLNLKQNGKG